jgi:hypothetical protein
VAVRDRQCGGAQGGFQVRVPGSGFGRLDPSGGFVAAGAGPGPGREVGGGREDAHVGSGLGDDHLRGPCPDTGDGADQVGEGAKGVSGRLMLQALIDGQSTAGPDPGPDHDDPGTGPGEGNLRVRGM